MATETEARTVPIRGVCIILECFAVFLIAEEKNTSHNANCFSQTTQCCRLVGAVTLVCCRLSLQNWVDVCSLESD